MSVASTETELFKDKIEVSLDGRQIFYLFFGGAVIATLVFVLGVMVGRRVESRSVAETGSPTTDPLAALDRLEGGSDLAFPAALRGSDVSLGAVDATLADRKKPMAVGGPVPAQASDDKVVEAEVVDDKVEHDKAEHDKAEHDKAIKPAGDKPKEDKAAAKAEKLEAEAAQKAEKEAALEEARSVPKALRRRFTLQVGSFQDKVEADTFFRDLAGTSYDPYMVEADVPGKGKYFRVRVGGYGTFEEAVAAKAQFEENQRVIAYVTRLK